MIGKIRSTLKCQKGNVLELSLIFFIVAALVVLIFSHHRAIKSKQALEAHIQTVKKVDIKEESTSDQDGVFYTYFEEYIHHSSGLVRVSAVVRSQTVTLPELLVDIDNCIIFKIQPDNIERIDQGTVRVEMVTTCPLPEKYSTGPKERILFSSASKQFAAKL